MKKGQATVFMIIGITLVVLFGLILIFINKTDPELVVPDEGKGKIDLYVETCIYNIVIEGATMLGAQGGYINLPEDYVSTEELDIAYGNYLGINVLATKVEMEYELAVYIDSRLLQCVSGFEDFHERVSYELPQTNVNIGMDSINVETTFPVRIDDERIDTFDNEIFIPLGRFHSYALQIIENMDPDWVDLSYLSGFPVSVNIQPYDDSILYYLSDDYYLFVFASYDEVNKAPILNIPDEFVLVDGMPWFYKVNCTDPEGDRIIVEDDTSMLETFEDGSILSTPEIPGRYDVTFTCSDDHYNRAEKTVLIIVE